ncbi:MAG: hypothetical protein Kow0056_10530 [Coriobacteriia bacterium]
MGQKEDLLRVFAIRSLVVLAAVAVLLGIVVTVAVRQAVIRGAAQSTSLMASAVLGAHVRLEDLDSGLSPEQRASLDDMFVSDVGADDLLAAKVWDSQGRLVYSSFAEDVIGESHLEDPELAAALSGEMETEIVLTPEEESRHQFDAAGPLLEVYLPLTEPDSGQVAGAFEAYTAYAPVQAGIRTTSAVIWAVLLVGSAAAFVVQFSVVRRAVMRVEEAEAYAERVEQKLQSTAEEFEKHALGTLAGLVSAVDAKDEYTGSHSLAVAEYATAIGVELGLSSEERKLLERAALLHDIGKIGTPGDILRKPGRLDEGERLVINEHSAMGAQIVDSIPFLRDVVPIIRHHHERWDGSGYPDGLWGEEIPRLARILAVADAFDAMTSDRPYRTAKSVDEALAEIERCSGQQFDPEAVRALVLAVGRGEVSLTAKYEEPERSTVGV